MQVVMITALAVATWCWWQGRKAVAGTSLQAAWRWGVAALTVSLVAASAGLVDGVSPGAIDHLWYAACVLWVAPAVAVLGARRPGSGAWSGFVMVPLLLVLEWPVTGVAVAARIGGVAGGPLLEPVRLDWPEMVGWLVVLVLGIGNYVMTRRGAVVVCGAGGVLALLWPLTGSVPPGQWTEGLRLTGCLVVTAAVWLVSRPRAKRQSDAEDDVGQRLARAWDDFYQAYGLVWAVRVEARVNQDLARLEGGGRLGPGGVEFPEESLATAEQKEMAFRRAETTLRWLWKRFVDEAWVSSRLGPSAPLGAKEPPGL